jgi:tetratricopeptide (TPR) repeat protein
MNRLVVAAVIVVWQLAGCRAQPPSAPPLSAQPPPPAATPQPEAAPRRVPEATSLLGRPLYPPPMELETLARRGSDLAQAQRAFREDPLDVESIIWFGRRLAYLGRYRQAIAVFSDGIVLHPNSYKLLRHRGHRYITTRRLDEAIADLTMAAALIDGAPDEVEPDGLPNAENIPTSTSHTNIYYHLGLAHYLKGQFIHARDAYRRCLYFADNDDMRCATMYWLYLTLRRLGRDEEARVMLGTAHAEMEIIENFAYQKLLLLYKGELSVTQLAESEDPASPVGVAVDDATLAYGIGALHLVDGDLEQAYAMFNTIVAGEAWPAFGYIAAEAELTRWVVSADE